MIELVAILALIIACRRLRHAGRGPTRVEVHVYVHGLPGGPGEPVFFEEPEDPSANVVPFPRSRYAADTPRPVPRPPLTAHWFN
jgi:hypothetical protein